MPRTEIPGKFTPERSAIAAQLRQFRHFDTSPDAIGVNYLDGSDLNQYFLKLGGIENYIKYVKSISPEVNLFVDIGGGYGSAAAQLQRSSLGEGLDVRITTLGRRRGSAKRFIGDDKVFLTSAERLDGISDESVSGMIAVSSLVYCVYPDLAVKSIDRVLKPGGAIKAAFWDEVNVPDGKIIAGSLSGLRHGSRAFREAFASMGYDVVDGEKQYMSAPSILLAIKPGGNNPHISALELVKADNGLQDVMKFKYDSE